MTQGRQLSPIAEKIMADAAQIAQRLLAGEMSKTVCAEYGTNGSLLKRTLRKAGYDFGDRRKNSTVPMRQAIRERIEQVRMEAELENRRNQGHIEFMCQGCGQGYEEPEGLCPKCHTMSYERVQVPIV